MAKEIERKYLVKDDSFRSIAIESKRIAQGYLSTDPERVVRLRITDTNGHNAAFLTIKSKNVGCVRSEWEYEIPVADAEELLQLCTNMLVKTRHIVPYDGFVWEVDEFGGRHEGLIVAEIELPDPAATYTLPSFVGDEVTGNPAYYNSNLAKD